MTGEKKQYNFHEVISCEMCNDNAKGHKILGQRLNKSQGFRPKRKEGIAVSVKKCSNCGLIYSSPLPVPFDIQDHYGVPPEDYWTPSYFEYDPTYFASEIKTLLTLINYKPGMRALDVGAGLGKSMISLTNAGFDTYGFEPSKPFYERALSKMNIDKSKLKLAMIEEAEYEDESFDFITFGAVFEHLYHPLENLQKAFKWLKKDGIIHIEVPSSSHLIARLFNFYYRLIGTNYVTHLSPMHSPFHMYEFGLKSFTAIQEKLKFEVVHTEYYVCDIAGFPKFLHPLLRWYMKTTKTGMQLTVWLRKKA